MAIEVQAYRTLLTPPAHATEREAAVTGATIPRRANLISTMAHLHLRGAQSRSELVAGLNLSRSGIGSLIGELVDRGIAEDAGVDRQPSPGRPSLVVRLNAHRAVAIAVEIGPGEVAVASVGLGGVVFDLVRQPMPERAAVPDVVEAVRLLVDDQLDRLPADAIPVGVGVAVAGLVNNDGLLLHAPNLGWGHTDLRSVLRTALPSGLTVTVGNESTLATIGEYLRGSLRGVDNGLLISGNAGVGGGAVVNGRLLWGANGLAAEVGHMKVQPDGAVCGCGGRGCWETVIGLPAILRASGLTDLPADTDPIEALAAGAAAGDAEVLAALDDAGRWVATGLGNLLNVLNPTRIVFGGRLGRLLPHLRTTVEEEMARQALLGPLAECDIVEPDLGKDATLIGASEQVLWHVLTHPEDLLLDDAASA